MSDFNTYSKQMAKIAPTGVNSASYSPTNEAQSCPTVDGTWKAEDTLPPSPNSQLCSCMVSNLTCVAKPDMSDVDLQANFDYLCNPKLGTYCDGINANATTGKYGSYGMCNAKQQVSWAMNEFFLDQQANNPKNTNPCNFHGSTTQTPKLASSCKALVSQAGAGGTGTVTSAPTNAAPSGSSSKSSAAGATTIPVFDFGLLQLAIYVATAGMVGAGMILL